MSYNKEQQKRYRKKNREKIKRYMEKWRKEDYLKNHDKILLQNKLWRDKNKEWCKNYLKEYEKLNRERIKEYRRKYFQKIKVRDHEKHRENLRKWRENNPEKVKEQRKRNYRRNREKRLKATREWREKNREHIKEYNKKYKSEYLSQNREKEKVRVRKWCKENPHKRKILYTRYLARKNNVIHSFTSEEWSKRVETTNGICPKCHTFVGTENLTLDHIFPLAKAEISRIYTINDVQPLCFPCNASKGDDIAHIEAVS